MVYILKKMKKLIILFLIPFSLNAQFQLEEDYSFKQDKQYHVLAGAAISGTVFTIVYKKTKDESLAMRAGWMSACSAGFIKEFTGALAGKEISIADMLYTTLSGVAVGYIAKGIVKRKKKKQIDDKIIFDLENEIFIK
jgi:VanZ family protein